MSKLHCAIIRRRTTAGLVIGAVLGLSASFAQAGPCRQDIAQFEAAMHQSASNPNAGLMTRQSIGAQLDRQPTVASVRRAEESMKSKFSATLAREKRLDAQGNRAAAHALLPQLSKCTFRSDTCSSEGIGRTEPKFPLRRGRIGELCSRVAWFKNFS